MGRRLTQTIYTCDLCGKTPEGGEYMWHMGSQVWCEECCDKEEKKKEECTHPRDKRVYVGRGMLRCTLCDEEFS